MDAKGGLTNRKIQLAFGTITLGLAVALAVVPGVVTAASCSKTEIQIGIVKAEKGCFVAREVQGRGTVYDSTGSFEMNGFKVTPRKDSKVTFTPPEQAPPAPNKPGSPLRSGTVDTTGSVDLSAANGTFGEIKFNQVSFAFAPPNTGEVLLSDSALAQPIPGISGLTPLTITQPIKLVEGGASIDLNFSLEGLFKSLVTGRDRELSFGLGFKVAGGKWRLGSGRAAIRQIELAKLLFVREASVNVDPPTIAVDVDASLRGLDSKGIAAGFTLDNGQLARVKLGLTGLQAQLGTSGVFLQGLTGEVFTVPPYGGSADIELTAGPKQKFLGKEVTAFKANGSVKFRSADVTKNDPGSFRVGGKFEVASIPVGDASFGYRFGQGTDFSASVGIGLPCLCNNSAQPTYLGGRLSGWTSASGFDLEGNAALKVLGINLLGAQTVVSNYGMAGCLRVFLWIGGGIRWSDGRGEMLGGWTCNLGGYKRSPGARLAAARLAGSDDGETKLTLADDVRVVRIQAPEGEDAPDLKLEDRQGNVLETPDEADPNSVQRFGEEGASMADEDGMSAFILPGDAARRWTLTEGDGSSPVESIEYATKAPDADVQAEVVGEWRRRTLRWSANDIPHQRLQFSEVLPDGREVPILETEKPNGARRFLPVEGIGTWGDRKLAVDVMQRFDTPRDELVADDYAVDRLAAPPAVGHLRVAPRLNDVVAHWQPVPRADHYDVTARVVGEGGGFARSVDGDVRSVRLRDVGTENRLRVSVQAVTVQGRRGRAATVVLSGEPAPDRQRALRHLVASLDVNASGNVVGSAPCPARSYCYGRISLGKDGRVVGSASFEVPAEMSDRVVIRMRRALKRRLAAGQSVRGIVVEGSMRQVGGASDVRIRRALRRR